MYFSKISNRAETSNPPIPSKRAKIAPEAKNKKPGQKPRGKKPNKNTKARGGMVAMDHMYRTQPPRAIVNVVNIATEGVNEHDSCGYLSGGKVLC